MISINKLIVDEAIHYFDIYWLATFEKAIKYKHRNAVISQKKTYPRIMKVVNFPISFSNFYTLASPLEFSICFRYFYGNVKHSPSTNIGIITNIAEYNPTQRF